VNELVLDIVFVLQSINEKIDGLTKQHDVVTKENVKIKDCIVYLENRLTIYETPKDSYKCNILPSKDSLAVQAGKSKSF